VVSNDRSCVYVDVNRIILAPESGGASLAGGVSETALWRLAENEISWVGPRCELPSTLDGAARKQLHYFLAEGGTLIEINSGYELDPAAEVKMLQVAWRLGETAPIHIVTTFLAAHV